MMAVHVYRNRNDDRRGPADMHFCRSCNGWYGVPHTDSHCQTGDVAKFKPEQCACRFCCEATDRMLCGTYGFFTGSPEWQP